MINSEFQVPIFSSFKLVHPSKVDSKPLDKETSQFVKSKLSKEAQFKNVSPNPFEFEVLKLLLNYKVLSFLHPENNPLKVLINEVSIKGNFKVCKFSQSLKAK